MDKNIISGSKKFAIVLFIIFAAFFLLIVKAYDIASKNNYEKIPVDKLNSPSELYLSRNNDIKLQQEIAQKQLNITLPEISDNLDFLDDKQKENTQTSNELAPAKDVSNDIITTIEMPDTSSEKKELTNNTITEDTVQKIFSNAYTMKKNGEYVNAIAELQKVQNLTNDKKLIAQSYADISKLYAIYRRYGTALSYASRAYNTYPSTENEILLARIYYKSGDTENANKRITNIMTREFINDK